MPEPKQLRIVIDADGNCKAEGLGFIGAECDRAMREIDQAIGQRTHTTRKPEYQQHGPQRQTQTNG